ncbi:MAG: hypothetical protein LUG18_15545 [Candidatus Azobacteroides sp.]|nr:hypothetical protein [Candidatus Azobacteroides sp.]
MRNGRIQVANDPGFRDSLTMYVNTVHLTQSIDFIPDTLSREYVGVTCYLVSQGYPGGVGASKVYAVVPVFILVVRKIGKKICLLPVLKSNSLKRIYSDMIMNLNLFELLVIIGGIAVIIFVLKYILNK